MTSQPVFCILHVLSQETRAFSHHSGAGGSVSQLLFTFSDLVSDVSAYTELQRVGLPITDYISQFSLVINDFQYTRCFKLMLSVKRQVSIKPAMYNLSKDVN